MTKAGFPHFWRIANSDVITIKILSKMYDNQQFNEHKTPAMYFHHKTVPKILYGFKCFAIETITLLSMFWKVAEGSNCVFIRLRS